MNALFDIKNIRAYSRKNPISLVISIVVTSNYLIEEAKLLCRLNFLYKNWQDLLSIF